jgi:anti-sigma regulatory factor (Ser/Thr protein kinase)
LLACRVLDALGSLLYMLYMLYDAGLMRDRIGGHGPARVAAVTALTRTTRVLHSILPAVAADGGRLDGASGAWQTFAGTVDQVAAVRRFVRSTCGDHSARDDAVLVASELSANAIAHSRSGQRGGMFGVHLAVLNAWFVVVVVTDQGGPTAPRAPDAHADGESGRGLAVVDALAAGVIVTGGRNGRSVAALVPTVSEPTTVTMDSPAQNPVNGGP